MVIKHKPIKRVEVKKPATPVKPVVEPKVVEEKPKKKIDLWDDEELDLGIEIDE